MVFPSLLDYIDLLKKWYKYLQNSDLEKRLGADVVEAIQVLGVSRGFTTVVESPLTPTGS